MALTPYMSGQYNVLGLTHRIATYERMAITHAYSLQHYGSSYMDPYTVSGEYPGDLSVKLLNRAYMLFAANARHHFVSMLFYFFSRSPFSSANSSIILPLRHIRVLRSVGMAEARKVRFRFVAEMPQTPDTVTQYRTNIVVAQMIDATMGEGTVSGGDTVVQLGVVPFQQGAKPLSSYTVAGGAGTVGPVQDPFAYYPRWRVIGGPRGAQGASLGTQYSTVLRSAPTVELSDNWTDFLPRILSSPTTIDHDVAQNGIWLRVPDSDLPLDNPVGRQCYPYTGDYSGWYNAGFADIQRANTDASCYNNFAAFSGSLVPYPGELSVITGGRLVIRAPKEPLPQGFVIALRGETEFRPAITLDRCEPYQVQSNVSDQYARVPAYPASAPTLNKLSPLLLYPYPSFEHAGFLSKYHTAVAQAAFLSHLSPDDSRYSGEKEVLTQFVEAMAKEPDKEFRQRFAYPTDTLTGNSVIRTG